MLFQIRFFWGSYFIIHYRFFLVIQAIYLHVLVGTCLVITVPCDNVLKLESEKNPHAEWGDWAQNPWWSHTCCSFHSGRYGRERGNRERGNRLKWQIQAAIKKDSNPHCQGFGPPLGLPVKVAKGLDFPCCVEGWPGPWCLLSSLGVSWKSIFHQREMKSKETNLLSSQKCRILCYFSIFIKRKV